MSHDEVRDRDVGATIADSHEECLQILGLFERDLSVRVEKGISSETHDEDCVCCDKPDLNSRNKSALTSESDYEAEENLPEKER